MNEPADNVQHQRPLWLAALLTTIATPVTAYLLAGFAEAFRGGRWGSDVSMRSIGNLTAPFVCLAAAIIGGTVFYAIARSHPDFVYLAFPQVYGAASGLLAGVIFTLFAGIRFRRPQAHPKVLIPKTQRPF